MKRLAIAAVLALSSLASTAHAYTLPSFGLWYFVGSTDELYRIRAAMDKVAGYPETSWTPPYAPSGGHVISPPWGMGPIDCMGASYWPGQGPYDGAEDYLGMSVELPDGIVEIPTLEDLVRDSDPDWPGQCFGYQYAIYCTGWLAEWICPDPEPEP